MTIGFDILYSTALKFHSAALSLFDKWQISVK